MEKLLEQLEQAINRYQRFTNNQLIVDLIEKLEYHREQLLTLNNKSVQ